MPAVGVGAEVSVSHRHGPASPSSYLTAQYATTSRQDHESGAYKVLALSAERLDEQYYPWLLSYTSFSSVLLSFDSPSFLSFFISSTSSVVHCGNLADVFTGAHIETV